MRLERVDEAKGRPKNPFVFPPIKVIRHVQALCTQGRNRRRKKTKKTADYVVCGGKVHV